MPTSEMKISTSAERGEGRGERGEGRGERGEGSLALLYLACDFSGPSSTPPVFAIRPRSEGEGDAPSRVSPSRTKVLIPKANKRGEVVYHLLPKRLPR